MLLPRRAGLDQRGGRTVLNVRRGGHLAQARSTSVSRFPSALPQPTPPLHRPWRSDPAPGGPRHRRGFFGVAALVVLPPTMAKRITIRRPKVQGQVPPFLPTCCLCRFWSGGADHGEADILPPCGPRPGPLVPAPPAADRPRRPRRSRSTAWPRSGEGLCDAREPEHGDEDLHARPRKWPPKRL